MRQVPWNRKLLDRFIEVAMLTEFQEKVMRTRVEKSWTVKKQAREFHVAEITIHRTIRKLKDIYDEVQPHYPDELPPRKHSTYEDYLDNN